MTPEEYALAYDQNGELYRDRFRNQMEAATELIAEVDRLRADLAECRRRFEAIYDLCDEAMTINGMVEVRHVLAALSAGGGDAPAADHPHTDPGDGRSQCGVCGKWVWPVTHSCKGVRVAPAGGGGTAEGDKP